MAKQVLSGEDAELLNQWRINEACLRLLSTGGKRGGISKDNKRRLERMRRPYTEDAAIWVGYLEDRYILGHH